MILHSENTKPYKCPHAGCTKAYKTERGLRDHDRTHSSQPLPHECDVPGCDARFGAKYNATAHRNKHEDCPTCKNPIPSIKKDDIAKHKKMCSSGKTMLDRWAESDKRKASEDGSDDVGKKSKLQRSVDTWITVSPTRRNRSPGTANFQAATLVLSRNPTPLCTARSTKTA